MTAKKNSPAGKSAAADETSAPAEPYEALLGVIERKLGELESGDLTLEKSLQAYEEGVRALKQCYGILKQAEGKIRILTSSEGEPELADYEAESGEPSGPGKRKAAKADAGDSEKELF